MVDLFHLRLVMILCISSMRLQHKWPWLNNQKSKIFDNFVLTFFCYVYFTRNTVILTAPTVKIENVATTMSDDITRNTTAARAEKYNSILSKFAPQMLSALSMYKMNRIAVSANTIIAIIQNASAVPHVGVKLTFDKIDPTISEIYK